MLTEEQKKNFRIFMGRVPLKGEEVAAFNDLVNAVLAVPVVEPVAEPKKK